MGVAKYIKDDKDAVKEVVYQSGMRIKPSYTPEDLEAIGFDYAQDLGEPGEYPFTRSLHPNGYRSRAWTTRQYTGFGRYFRDTDAGIYTCISRLYFRFTADS